MTPGGRTLVDYEPMVGPVVAEHIGALAEGLRGRRVVHHGVGSGEAVGVLGELMGSLGMEVEVFGSSPPGDGISVLHGTPGEGAGGLWRVPPEVVSTVPAGAGGFQGLLFPFATALVPPGVPCYLVPPCIDPLAERNRQLREPEVDGVLRGLGVPREVPLVVQVSRGLEGAREVHRWLSRHMEVQTVVSVEGSPPAGVEEPGFRVVAGGADVDVNGLQRAADVVVQADPAGGWGLGVLEALWKGKVVVARPGPGLHLSLVDGVTGYLGETAEALGARVRMALRDPDLSHRVGSRGREHVRHNFLITRQLWDYLQIFHALQTSP